MKPIYLILLLTANFAVATETNIFFVTDDGFLFRETSSNGVFMAPGKVELAKKSQESLPAETFPEGNWGSITNGFQLSLRFEKQTFRIGEPIIATTLLRNVTNKALNYAIISFVGVDGPVDFAVTAESGKILSSTADKSAALNSGEKTLFPQTQHKYVERLDRRFELQKAGKYTVHGEYVIAFRPERVVVESAKVTIEIQNPPSSSGSSQERK